MIVKAIGGHVNFILLKSLKAVCPYMGSGLTHTELEERFN